MSKADDAQWQGDKREGLQRGLHHVLSERAKELIQDKDVQTKSFALELRVDGTLEKGQYRVQPVWDSSAPKTEVKPRKPVLAPATTAIDVEETIAAPVNESPATLVRPRAPLFVIEYGRAGESPETLSAHKTSISIGRGAKDMQVDLRLDGDLEISRKHATLEQLEDGRFAIMCEGRNSLEVAGREVQQGDRLEFESGALIKIGIYQLKCTAPVKAELPLPDVAVAEG
ncbi:MAG: FHA domain-containing protein [Blastocatellia bacterium]